MKKEPIVWRSGASGVGGGALVVWLLGFFLPETSIPPEAAAALGGLLGMITGPIIRKFQKWAAT